MAYEINNNGATGDDVAAVKLKRRTLDGTTADVVIEDLTSRLAYDGAKNRVHIDLRGLPAAGVIPAPLWGNGKTTKEALVHPYDAATIPIITVKSPAKLGSECFIYGITWFFVG